MNKITDETLKEILEEDKKQIKQNGKKKNWFARLLLFLVVLFILGLGFIYVQQYLLDIEAQAIVSAARTSTAAAMMPGEENAAETEESAEVKTVEEETLPTLTPTTDPAFKRTATIAVQLTDVAEFQQTVTREP